MRAERLTDQITHHGEGAVWWTRLERLRVVDLLAGDVLTLTPDGEEVERTPTGSPVVAIVRPLRLSGAVLALERGLAVTEHDDLSDLRPLGDLLPDSQRFNEGGCDPQGRFWAGSMAYDQTEYAAALRRWSAPTPTVVINDVTVSNGLGWSPDGMTAYYNDTPSRQIVAFDFEAATGKLSNRRVFADLREVEGGFPDGLCVDAEGGVWTALFSGGAVRRYAADGELSEVIEVDARQVTSCAFGGPDLATLFITTSRENLAEGDDPAAGSVFVATPGMHGLPVLEADPQYLLGHPGNNH